MRPSFMFINQPIKRLVTMLSIISMVFLLNACGSDSDRHKRLDTITANARVSSTDTFLHENDNEPIVYINDLVNLDGATSNSHVDILSYTWSQTGGTPVTLSDSTATAPTFIAPNAGSTLTFELEVVDTEGHVDVDSLDIIVAEPIALSASSASTINLP